MNALEQFGTKDLQSWFLSSNSTGTCLVKKLPKQPAIYIFCFFFGNKPTPTTQIAFTGATKAIELEETFIFICINCNRSCFWFKLWSPNKQSSTVRNQCQEDSKMIFWFCIEILNWATNAVLGAECKRKSELCYCSSTLAYLSDSRSCRNECMF